MILLMCMVLLWSQSARAEQIPADVFPGMVFDPPLEDSYQSGEAILIAGLLEDEALADGQFLLQFSPADGGEPVQVFVNLAGVSFRHYHIFGHDQADSYELDLFLGGADEDQLSHVGTFDRFTVGQGGGAIVLPSDFFPGVLLDQPLSTRFTTSAGVSLAGRIFDSTKANGQILFNFVHVESGDEVAVFIPLEGLSFRRGYLFSQVSAGTYDLEVFVGGEGEGRLGFVGRFWVELVADGAPVTVPVDFFTGVLFDQPLDVEWPVGRDLVLQGGVAPGIGSLRFDVSSAVRDQSLTALVEEGRFALTLRLDPGEQGAIRLQVVREVEDGLLLDSGSFDFRAVEPPSPPVLSLSAMALGLLPGREQGLTLANLGAESLDELRFELEGPFTLVAAPNDLAAGNRAEVVIRYDGAGGDHGLLLVRSDDPLRPVQRVALNGLSSGEMPRSFVQQRADAGGFIHLELDLGLQDYALVLYTGAIADRGNGLRYPYALGVSLPAARRAAWLAQGGHKWRLRQRERVLAERWSGYRGPVGKKAVGVLQVGQQREFVFGEFDGVPKPRIGATLVAVSERALGWLQDDLRPHEDNIDAEWIAAIIEQFSSEDFARTAAAFGQPSDVDADGRITFLFTHLVDDLDGVAGFYTAFSLLPDEVGGDGNETDMLFISPTQPRNSYRPLLVHEFQHLINFNEHVLERRGQPEATWLDEGLSHLAEDLVAGYAESGQGGNIAVFLREPEAVSLEMDASDDANTRGAAYLFVRSLVDRMGAGVLLRLVGTGLADRANVEAATGEGFAELLAAWGTQLYASGLGLSTHPRFNYGSELLRAGSDRGFPLPAEGEYDLGGPGLGGTLPHRGLAFVRVRGTGREQLEIATDPAGQVGVVAIPLERDFASRVRVPADYVPGLRFDELVPAVLVAGREYSISGEAIDGQINDFLLGFAGADTLDFFADFNGTSFTAIFEIPQPGAYELNFFTGPGGGESLDFAVDFGPIWVRDQSEPTAVAAEMDGLPGAYSLGRIYPNPFNASAVLPLSVPDFGGEVAVDIFNALGQRVRRLHRGGLPAGAVELVWDGRGDGGHSLASGLYIARVQAPGFAAVRRTVLLR